MKRQNGRIAIHKRDFNRRGRGHLAPQTHEVLRVGATESDARAKAANRFPRSEQRLEDFFWEIQAEKKVAIQRDSIALTWLRPHSQH